MQRWHFYAIRNKQREFSGSPVVRTHASTADSLALISGGRTKIPQALRWGKKKKKKSAKWLPLVWWCDSKRHEGVSEVLESLFL